MKTIELARNSAVCSMVLLLANGVVQAQTVYKSVDEEGTVTFTDRPVSGQVLEAVDNVEIAVTDTDAVDAAKAASAEVETPPPVVEAAAEPAKSEQPKQKRTPEEIKAQREAFLAAGVDRVDLPAVDLQGDPAERGDGVDDRQTVEAVGEGDQLACVRPGAR